MFVPSLTSPWISASEVPFVACKSQMILYTQKTVNACQRDERATKALIMFHENVLVCCLHFATNDAVTKSVVVLVVVITPSDEHLQKWHLLTIASINVLESLSYGPRCNNRLRGAMWAPTILTSIPCEVLELHARWALRWAHRLAIIPTGASSATRWGSALACAQLIFAQVGLYVPVDHLVQNTSRNVLQRLSKRSSHLVLDLSFKEVVETFALWLGKSKRHHIANSVIHLNSNMPSECK